MSIFIPVRAVISFLIFFLLTLIFLDVRSQSVPGFRDSLDGKLDASDWVLDAHGFIPVPVLITEPALGGIGGALFPVFITRNEAYTDTVDGKVITERVRPDIYGLGGAYTANGTWLAAAAASGVLRSWRAHYRVASGYADVNLDFYKEISKESTKAFTFNIQTFPVYGQLIKQLGRGSHWYAGMNYLFLKTKLKSLNAAFHDAKAIDAQISRLGVLVDFDRRDNIFTPDRGFRWNTLIAVSDNILGSDYDYVTTNSSFYSYFPLPDNLIAAARIEYQQVWGDMPFYLVPFINLRGIPVARYQGEIITTAETEWRWDIKIRWSLVAFAGAGKATDDWQDYSNSGWKASGGGGFRYLLARKLKLRMGFDIAHGPEELAYYMVFGTSWVK